MTNPVVQPALSAGELSPYTYGRVDLEKYHSGVALSRNFYVDYRGGLINRAGTRYVGQCLSTPANTKPRLIPFTFSTIQTYILVFTDLKMRVIMNGGEVLEPSKNITNITQANPAIVTSASHGFSNGDWVFITGVSGMTQVNGKDFIVSNVTTNTFQLNNLNNVPIDSSAFGGYSFGGTVSRIFTLTTPYAASDLPLLKFVQSADTMTFTHQSYAPRNLTRTQHWVWTLTTLTFGPSIAAPTGVSATSSNSGSTGYNYVVTAVGPNGLTESRASNVGSVTGHRLSDFSNLTFNTVSWTGVAGATQYNVYRTLEISTGSPASGAQLGFVGAADGTATSFKDNNFLPDMSIQPPTGNNPFATDWPACATYYQQRLTFGGTPLGPDTITFSKSADFNNMDYSMPTKDDDSIVVRLAAREVNAIKHMIPLTSMIAFTSGGAWKIDGGTQSDALTPTHVLALPQVYTGCSDVPPITVVYNILYVQSMGNIVRDLHFNFYVNVYTGDDISLLSNHLFENHSILEWAYAEQPWKVIWSVREDGIVLSLTYLSEQQIYGWTRHDSTNGLFKSVASIAEGTETATYFVVERVINNNTVRYIERMQSRQLGGDVPRGTAAPLTSAWFVDAGLQYTGSAVSSVSGLDHLEGQTVAVLADGSEQSRKTVTNGSITLDVAASNVIAGLPIQAQGQTLYLSAEEGKDQGKRKKVSAVTLRVKDTRGLQVGPDFNNLRPIKERTTQALGAFIPPITGDERILIPPTWNVGGQIVWQTDSPLPAQILAVIPEVTIGDD